MIDKALVLTDYKYAKNKKMQLKILAQLNDCTRKKIIQILEEAGINPDKKNRWEIDWESIEKLYKKGFSDSKISRILGISSATVLSWRRRNGLDSNYTIQRRRKQNDKSTGQSNIS